MKSTKEKLKEAALEATEKVKKFVTDHKDKIKGFASAFGVVVLVSIVTFVILLLTGVVISEEGELVFNQALFEVYKGSWWGSLAIVAILSVLGILLCFIPGLSAASIFLVMEMYPETVIFFGEQFMLEAFLISFARVLMSSAILYVLGRFGGYALCKKLLGEEDSEKALKLLRENGTIYFPLMMMFPIFPDDALTMVAGTIKMKMSWFVPSIVLGRGIGVFTIVFGMNALLPKKDSTSYFYDWFILVTVAAFALLCIFYLAAKLNKNLELKRKGKAKPFKMEDLKLEDTFGILVAMAVLVVGIVLFNVDLFFPPTLISIYEWFELLIMAVFWSVLSYFFGRGLYQAFKHSEKYGKPLFMMRKVTLLRLIPVFVSVGVAVVLTGLGALLGFFPTMDYPYDWMIVVTAYIIWMTAIYVITSKVISRLKKIIEKKHHQEHEA